MSEKQKAYFIIMETILPFIRNTQRRSWWHRLRTPPAYEEVELIHNLPRLLVEPAVGQEDIYWLNTQAYIYLSCGRCKTSPMYDMIKREVFNVLQIVPDDLRGLLEITLHNQGDEVVRKAKAKR